MSKLNPKYTNAIWDATEVLQDEEQMENGISAILEILVNCVDCENGFAWIHNKKEDVLSVLACTGKNDVTGVSQAVDQGLIGYAYTKQEDVIIDDTVNDIRFSKDYDEETGYKTRNTLIVPIMTKRSVYGCIQLINKVDDRFNEQDQMLCSNLSALVALDIEDKGYEIKLHEKGTPIISLKNVTKEFPSGESTIQVLKGIDLDIFEGEFLVVLGESGCGKTTMLNIIGGMDALTNGNLYVDGEDFSRPTDSQLTVYRRDYIGFIFQSYNLMPNLSALENVEFVAENSTDPIDAEDAIEMVGLTSRANNFPAQMSGGQQQRVSIARALVKNPKVILADEPTAALDFQTGQEILGIVEEIVRKQKKTVVMITHNAEIAKMADRVVKLRGGLISSIRVNTRPMSAKDIAW